MFNNLYALKVFSTKEKTLEVVVVVRKLPLVNFVRLFYCFLIVVQSERKQLQNIKSSKFRKTLLLYIKCIVSQLNFKYNLKKAGTI